MQETVYWTEYFPVSYRVLALINLGIFYYFCIIVICHDKLNINIIRVFNLGTDYQYFSSLQYKTGKFLQKVVLLNLLSWLTYMTFLRIHGYVFLLEVVPSLTFIATVYLVVSYGENRVLSTLKRILLGKLDTRALRINDILLSDSLTSYSKIILDFANYIVYLTNGNKLDESGLDLVVLVLPQLIRLSQCWYEWTLSNRRNKQAILNFCKYSTNVLPLVMIFLTRTYKADGSTQTINPHLLRLEKACIFLNSVYTFVWDIFVDWNIKQLTISKIFLTNMPFRLFLILSTVFNFSLRFVWLWKFVFTNFYYFNDTNPQFNLFIMQSLEVTRRFIWCIHRLNSEAIKDEAIGLELDKL